MLTYTRNIYLSFFPFVFWPHLVVFRTYSFLALYSGNHSGRPPRMPECHLQIPCSKGDVQRMKNGLEMKSHTLPTQGSLRVPKNWTQACYIQGKHTTHCILLRPFLMTLTPTQSLRIQEPYLTFARLVFCCICQ